MHQWGWRDNATRPRSQTGVTITCDGHWKAHKLQDNDGQTQTSVSWAGRRPFPPPPPPGRLEMPTVDAAGAAFVCRSAALHISASCHFRMNYSAPSSTRRNYLPAFCAFVRHPSNFIPKTGISSFRCIIQSFPCPPKWLLPPTSSPNITLCGRRSSPMRITNPANILHLRTIDSMLSWQSVVGVR